MIEYISFDSFFKTKEKIKSGFSFIFYSHRYMLIKLFGNQIDQLSSKQNKTKKQEKRIKKMKKENKKEKKKLFSFCNV